ncbi:Pentatricopeptide repeat-containing protein [Acorus calamus]|uniref:Pentatricopeptide repeat-containing protein n=1 Tax=Acorus calamus TaxID=4465 RepID=A0AAV9EKA9_ACOCL|nr:Pentatricopeptide repeat-containing protein [Acorus calamus]
MRHHHYRPSDQALALLIKSQTRKTLTYDALSCLTRLRPPFAGDLRCLSLSLHLLLLHHLLPSASSLAASLPLSDPTTLFHSLLSTSLTASPITTSAAIDLLVKTYSRLSMVDRAISTIDLARSHGLALNVLSYNSVLDALFKLNRPIDAFLHSSMLRSGVSLNVYSYNILIRGFCDNGDYMKALDFFNRMAESGCSPNVVTYNTLISAYSKEGRMREAREVIDAMNGEGLTPDRVTYNTLVNGHCKAGNPYEALAVCDDMARRGVAPDVVTYTSLIANMCRAGNVDRAMELLNQMQRRGLRPNEITYTALIDGFSRKGRLEEALEVMNEMVRNGFSDSVVTCNALINGYVGVGRMDEALEIVREMEAKGLRADVVSYGTIVGGYCKDGDLEKVFRVNREMVEKGICPDVITVLINGLKKAARTKEAKRLLFRLFCKDSVPERVAYDALMERCCDDKVGMKSAVSLLKGFCIKGLMGEADRVFGLMVASDEAAYNVMIHGHCRGGNAMRAYGLYKEMVRAGHVINAVSAISLIKGLFDGGMGDELNRVVQEILRGCKLMVGEAKKVMAEINHKEGNMEGVLNILVEMAEDGLLPSGRTRTDAYRGFELC